MSVNSKMTAIADAIRGKTGGTEVLTLDAMAVAINGIEVGGGNTLEFEEKELSFAPLVEGDLPMNTDCGLTELKEGATYDVTWDGTVYTCTTQRVDEEEGVYIIAMGNSAFITGEPDEVPFMFMYDAMGVMGMPSGVIVASLFDENPTHTVGVKFNFTAGGGTGGDAENDTPFALITASAKRGGNAVAGAAVTATNGTTQVTGTTDENGQCVLKASEGGTYTITSTYDGYTATNSVSVTVGSLSYTAAPLTFFSATITVSTETGATVTVEKDGKVQTAVSEDMQAVFTVYEAGTYTVTSYYNGNTGTAQVDVTTSGEKHKVAIYSSHLDLEETGWEQISVIGQSGEGQNYFSVGDTKSVELKGTVGTVVLDTTLLVYILGFNHNSEIEGNGIHFGGFKTTDGVDVVLVDSNYGNERTDINDPEHNWFALRSGYYYNLILDIFYNAKQYGTTSNWQGIEYEFASAFDGIGEKSLLGALPIELRNALKYATKREQDDGSKFLKYHSHMHLLAPYEISGQNPASSNSNAHYWKQYQYYIDGNSKVKYKHDSPNTACAWHTRQRDGSTIYVVNKNGATQGTTYISSFGIAPVFVL